MSATTTAESPPEKENPASGETSGIDEQNNIVKTTTSHDSTFNQNPQLDDIMNEDFEAADFKDDTCDDCGGVMSDCHCNDDVDDDEPLDWPHLLLQRVRANWDKEFVEKVIDVAGRLHRIKELDSS